MAIQEFEGFEWAEHNIDHLAKHLIGVSEAEQAILNRPVDLGWHLRTGKGVLHSSVRLIPERFLRWL